VKSVGSEQTIRWNISPLSSGFPSTFIRISIYFSLVSCSSHSSITNTGMICSSEMSFDFQRTTRCYVAEDVSPHYSCHCFLIWILMPKRFVGCYHTQIFDMFVNERRREKNDNRNIYSKEPWRSRMTQNQCLWTLPIVRYFK
jgi:hypothetical protein